MFGLFFFQVIILGQSSYVSKKIVLLETQTKIDTNSIAIKDFSVLDSINNPISDSLFTIDFVNSTLTWKGNLPATITLNYRILSLDLLKKYAHKDINQIHTKDSNSILVPNLFSSKKNISFYTWLTNKGTAKIFRLCS